MNTTSVTRAESGQAQGSGARRDAVPILAVIPAHATARTLPRCLEALRQSRPPAGLEVLVVHDGISQVALPPDVWQVQSPIHRSAAAARNRGAAELQQGVLVFLDADVLVNEESLALLVQPILAGTADATVGNYSSEVEGMTFLQRYKQLHVSTVYGRRHGYLKYEFWTAIGAIRAEAFHRVGGFDPSFRGACGEDTELGQRLTAAGFRILAVPGATGRHLHDFTLGKLLRNDLRKGTQVMLNTLRHGNRLADNRHSTRPEVLAVFCATILASLSLAIPVLPGPALAAVGLFFFGAWLLGRRDQLAAYARENPLFLIRAVPLALVLDWVRVMCVINALLQFAWGSRPRAVTRQGDSLVQSARANPLRQGR